MEDRGKLQEEGFGYSEGGKRESTTASKGGPGAERSQSGLRLAPVGRSSTDEYHRGCAACKNREDSLRTKEESVSLVYCSKASPTSEAHSGGSCGCGTEASLCRCTTAGTRWRSCRSWSATRRRRCTARRWRRRPRCKSGCTRCRPSRERRRSPLCRIRSARRWAGSGGTCRRPQG